MISARLTPAHDILDRVLDRADVVGHLENQIPCVYDSSPQEVADVLTYARREWGHGGEPITLEDVQAVMKEIDGRDRVWTPDELEAAQKKEL